MTFSIITRETNKLIGITIFSILVHFFPVISPWKNARTKMLGIIDINT